MSNPKLQKNIPNGWKTRKVSEIAKINTGDKDTQNKIADGRYPFFVRSQTVERINSYGFDGEAVLTSGDGVGVGKIYHYIDGKFDYHQRVYNIHNFTNEILGTYFFLYFSKNFYRRVFAMSAKNSVDSVRREMIANMLINFPERNEQERIVAVLETWDQAIEKLKRKIEVKKEIKKGLMRKLLTGEIRLAGFTGNWSIHNLGELGKIISGGTPETINPNYWGNDYIWITPTEITKLKSRYILDSDKRISTLGLKNSSATLVPPQSLILCSRATIAECAINTFEVTTNQGFKNFVPKKIDIHFFYYWVKLNKKTFLRISAGSTFLEFGKGDMEKLRIEIPDMKEQKAISEILTKADDEIERLKQKLLIFRDQKRYLLNNLVTGTIRTPETLSIPK